MLHRQNIIRFILVVLLTCSSGCGSDSQLASGKKWCESLIKSYRSDPDGFRKTYPPSKMGEEISVSPDHSKIDAMGVFFTHKGSFSCIYYETGFDGRAYRYTSQSEKWEKTN